MDYDWQIEFDDTQPDLLSKDSLSVATVVPTKEPSVGKYIHDMTLEDYRNGVKKVFDSYRFY